MSPPFWVWALAVIASMGAFLLLARVRGLLTEGGWMVALAPVMLCLVWPAAQDAARHMEPLEAYEINTGPCPGVVAYNEIRETSRKSVTDITAAFILNGWTNITVNERGHDSFWSSTYSVVAARCNLGGP